MDSYIGVKESMHKPWPMVNEWLDNLACKMKKSIQMESMFLILF